MHRSSFPKRHVCVLAIALASMSVAVWGQSGQPSTKNGEWPYYTADLKGTKYSPLDQINASNFNKLEIAWRFKTDNFGTRPEYKLEGTPLMVKGVLYTTAGVRRDVVALDAKTGEVNWVYSMREGKRAAIAPRQLSGRGVSYWTDGRGDERIVFVTTGYRLVELNAHTGQPIAGFGKDGIVDLKVGMVTGTGQQIDLENGEAGLHSTPLVVKDTVIVGSSFKEGMTVVTHNNTKGLVRAYDVHTGKLIWTFNTIPRPGEFGNDTWENNSWATNGNTGVWTQMTVDEDLGLVYLPVESPTSDYYGGERPGNNLFGESIVCVDLKTGKRKWHYQIVHHPIWDYDLSSAPILADINVNGRAIKAVAVPSKEAFLYVFDRVTGQPVWPIEERPVPQSDVPGEKTAATQPFPTKPPAYARNEFKVPDDLIDFTPEMRAQARDNVARYKTGPMFLPPIVGDPNGFLGAINLGNASGGTNWPGAGYDPETHIVYAQANQSAVTPISLRVPPQGFSDIRYVMGRKDTDFVVAEGPGFGSAADAPQKPRARAPARPAQQIGGLNVQGLSIIKPPYAVISAVNLDRGDLQWQVPYGETPDAIRNHPALKGMNIPNTGQPGSVGLVVTKSLVVLGDTQITSVTHPRGAMLRAYDKANGKEVGAVWMSAPQSGSPMTYMVDGKQYIVVAVSGGAYSGEYLAYSLPSEE
ncbi:MAG TPA: PQQ-binding-like beta-propeller repeat protein [Bryobacteraceae bacterium]|nr:PQQ-binding-like beta-propeller repeat protein [Bryobacteraceae bacterium]